MKTMTHTLRALSMLLSYPDASVRQHLGALAEAIEAEGALPAARRAEIAGLVRAMQRTDGLELEGRYVELFDSGRSTCLNLFEHVHGDSRDRGPAMIDLMKTYESAGVFMDMDRELPDHLCVVLEFASTQAPATARAFLGEMAHILQSIFSALRQRESGYAVLLAAVLELAGQKAQAVEVKPDEPLDEAWAEPEAFGGCDTRGQAAPGTPQPVRIVRRQNNTGATA